MKKTASRMISGLVLAAAATVAFGAGLGIGNATADHPVEYIEHQVPQPYCPQEDACTIDWRVDPDGVGRWHIDPVPGYPTDQR